VALTLLTIGVYLRGAGYEFVSFDDPTYVTRNPNVLGGLSGNGVAWAFTTDHAANWHPITWLSHMLDVELHGLDAGGHHVTNAVLHGLGVLVLLGALFALTGAYWPSFFVAALFALHPLRVESVAWISERKDLLAGLFAFVALWAYARYARRPSLGSYALVALALALSLMSKPTAVTLPFLLLLLDVWPLGRTSGEDRRSLPRLIVEKLPLFGLAAASILVTLGVQRGAKSTLEALPPGLRLENALATPGVYLMQTLDPTRLAVFYPHAAITGAHLLLVATFWGLATAVLTAWAWRVRATRPWWFVGLGWTLVMLLPVCGLIQVGMQAHADRYTYLPLIGVVLAVVEALRRWTAARAAWRFCVLGAGVAGLAACLLLSRQQVRVWHDSVTLFEHALAVTDLNYLAHNNLGTELNKRGQTAAAREHFEEALRIHPAFAEGANNLGLMLFEDNQLEKARLLLERAAAATPEDPVTRMNLGSVALAQGDLDLAEQNLRRAEEAGFVHADLDFNLGLLAQYRNLRDEAERRYRLAVERDPTHGNAWSNLGELQLFRGDATGAVASFQRAVELDPGDPIGQHNLGVACEELGDVARARSAYRTAVELDPGLEPARKRLLELEQDRED